MNLQNYIYKTLFVSIQLTFMIVLTLFIANKAFANTNLTYPPIHTVVIDAGHGGKDPGCSGKTCSEKDITLQISQKLGEMLQDNFPNLNVVYTRTTDEYLSLAKRASIANSINADLFISIHCNALEKNKTLTGSETYVLGLHRTDDNLEIVKRENVFHEGDELDNGLTSTENHILSSLYQEAMISRSTLFGRLVEERLDDYTSRKRSAVKQAGFAVLRETTMPSILIETGYLTTPKDEKLLNSEEGQYTIALAIYNAFVDFQAVFLDEAEITNITNPNNSEKAIIASNNIEDNKTQEDSNLTSTNEEPEVIIPDTQITTQPIVSQQEEEIAEQIHVEESKPSEIPMAKTYPLTEEEKMALNKETVITNTIIEETVIKEVIIEKPIVKEVTSTIVSTPVIEEYKNKVLTVAPVFYVQLRSSPTKLGSIKNKQGQEIEHELKYENKLYKYIVEPKVTYSLAKIVQQNYQKQGFADAFLVAYLDGKRISVLEAMKM